MCIRVHIYINYTTAFYYLQKYNNNKSINLYIIYNVSMFLSILVLLKYTYFDILLFKYTIF